MDKKKNIILISTILELEINEICELFLMNNRNCIKISQLLVYLKYKDPISYKELNYFKIRKSFQKLFPIHKNNRRKTKHLKISMQRVIDNKTYSDLKIKPSIDLKIEQYGIHKKLFKEI